MKEWSRYMEDSLKDSNLCLISVPVEVNGVWKTEEMITENFQERHTWALGLKLFFQYWAGQINKTMVKIMAIKLEDPERKEKVLQ